MLTPDPANHDDSYRYNVTVQNDKFLVEDFEYFYENKLTQWEDTLDDIIRNVLDADGLHPDKKLENLTGAQQITSTSTSTHFSALCNIITARASGRVTMIPI